MEKIKVFLQTYRKRIIIALAIGVPLVSSFVFGYVIHNIVKRLDNDEKFILALVQGNLPTINVAGKTTPLWPAIINTINDLQKLAHPTPPASASNPFQLLP